MLKVKGMPYYLIFWMLIGNAATYGQAVIDINRSNLNYGALIGDVHTLPQQVFIDNTGDAEMEWSITNDADWLIANPSSGVNGGVVEIWVDPAGLAPGTYTGTVTIEGTNANNSPQTVDVALKVYNTSSPPFGTFDTPIDGSTISGSVPLTGWVLDDIDVMQVKLYKQDVGGGNSTWLGDALFVEGARPDVEQAYPDYPRNYQAGWGYMMLTNFFPCGQYTIEARAVDSEYNETTLGTKTVTIDNGNAVKPFGAIDTPSQGGIASGTNFVNFGWALTPQPNAIPQDGSTINVYIDGVNVGHPTYNIYREDIATLFPGYANSQGAGGEYIFDTTQYANGVHTIQWTAQDDASNTDGIGSRYFTIQNPTYSGDQVGVDQTKFPKTTRLNPAYPNPFNPKTTISFHLQRDAVVELKVYDVSGRLINILLRNEKYGSGEQSIEWLGNDASGTSVPSGLYFIKFQTEYTIQTQKVMLIR